MKKEEFLLKVAAASITGVRSGSYYGSFSRSTIIQCAYEDAMALYNKFLAEGVLSETDNDS